MMRHMKAALAYHDKQVLPDGSIVELKIWHLAEHFLILMIYHRNHYNRNIFFHIRKLDF